VNRITDERLREIAESDTLVLALCTEMGEPSRAEVRENAAELLAARAEVRRLREQLHCRKCGGTVGVHLAPDQGGCTGQFVLDGVEMLPAAARQDVDDLRSEVRRLRAIEAAARRLTESECLGLSGTVIVNEADMQNLKAALAAKETP
jgi:hypothetical protein